VAGLVRGRDASGAVVAGVDGCPNGWVVVRAHANRKLRLLEEPFVVASFEELLDRTRDCAAVGVDIPIGLTDDKPLRPPDRIAKELLGWPRMTSVFPAPVRAALRANSHREACLQSLLASGKSISLQTYHIMAKIRDADAVMTPKRQARVVEVHPEVSFWAMNKRQALQHSKKRTAGRQERLALLAPRFTGDLAAVSPPAGAARDDLLDACAAAWSAARLARGTAARLLGEPIVDPRGLRMEIVY
jgi:predicted RNase H-like nuclease